MTPRQRKPWSRTITESGITVRVYEREAGSLLYREVRLDGGKDRKSLGHRDKVLAEQQARELARRLAELRLTGHTGSVTLGQLWRLYQQHRLPLPRGRAPEARPRARGVLPRPLRRRPRARGPLAVARRRVRARAAQRAAAGQAPARAALERYLRAHPKLGDAWLFPQRKRLDRAMTKMDAYPLFRRAEDLAELPHLDRGAFHPYRRLWAVERKHLPDVDVARGGGWRDLATMKLSYQQPDPETTLRAIENEPESGAAGHTSDTPQQASNDRTTA